MTSPNKRFMLKLDQSHTENNWLVLPLITNVSRLRICGSQTFLGLTITIQIVTNFDDIKLVLIEPS